MRQRTKDEEPKLIRSHSIRQSQVTPNLPTFIFGTYGAAFGVDLMNLLPHRKGGKENE